MSIFKKKKPLAVEETPEQKILKLKEQLRKMSEKSFQTQRMINSYGYQIEKVIQNVKNNPKNDFLVKSAQNQLKYLLAKKKLLERFSAIMDAAKMTLETRLTELRLTGGKDVIDSAYCEELTKLFDNCEEYFKMAQDATNVADLEGVMNDFCNITGESIGIDVESEVKDLLKDAINPSAKVEEKAEETVKKDAKSDIDIDSMLSKIRKDL